MNFFLWTILSYYIIGIIYFFYININNNKPLNYSIVFENNDENQNENQIHDVNLIQMDNII